MRQLGHDVTAIAHKQPGLADTEVLALALAEQRALITYDTNFGERIFRRQLSHVLLFHLMNEPVTVKIAWLEFVLNEHREQMTDF